jgi:hypothetical protein
MTGLGMTETSPSCTFGTGPIIKAGYVGVPAPGCKVKLVPVNGKLEARFHGAHVTPGYWRAPHLTAEAFDADGYYCTGDALRFVDEAHPELGFMFDGRIAEDFKLSSGTFVSVGPLRARVISQGAPYVQDAVVTGLNRHAIGLLVFPRMDNCLLLSTLPAGTPAAEVLASEPVRAFFKRLLDGLNADATGITAKSPYMLRTSMTMQQMTGPFGTWTAQNKISRVYSLVSDYSTGHDAERLFAKGLTEAGGKIVGSSRTPMANPDYSPFVQRVKDEKPEALFFFAPGVEDGIGLLKAFSDKGLDKAGISFLGVGDMTSDSPTLEALGDRALGAVTVLNYSTALDNEANKTFLKAYGQYAATARPSRGRAGAALPDVLY